MLRHLHLLTAASLLALACSLPREETPAAQAAAASPAPATSQAALVVAQPSVAPETALLSLVLPQEGRPMFDAVRRRAIAFHLPRPVDGPRPTPQVVAGESHFLAVHHPSLPAPLELPVELGSPSAAAERTAPAAPVWQGGGTILRAPCFGVGTRYDLVSVTPAGTNVLAKAEVAE
ncbi:MAG: hypothetical protein QM765_53530 [Myxococcales bacterium]